MKTPAPFDPLLRFAEIERLIAKIYYRFSHLLLAHPELRDFLWAWLVRKSSTQGFSGRAANSFSSTRMKRSIRDQRDIADQLSAFLDRGTPSLNVEDAFEIALDIESSEIDVIYAKLAVIEEL